MKRVLAGLKILEKHDPKGEFYAEHDQIWAGSNVILTTFEVAVMHSLGWFWDTDMDAWSKFV
jgi:hypothetical protein